MNKLVLALATATIVAGCAAHSYVASPRLATSRPSADVDALVDAFYGADPPPLQQLRARADEAIARHPDDGRAHEVAAYAALLAGDSAAVSHHLLAAAADLRADATDVYLSESGYEATAGEADAWHRVVDELSRRHPSASVRALATFRLLQRANRQGRLDQAARYAATLGFVPKWALLGALDNDQGKGFLTEHPPEKAIELAAEVPGPLVPLKWRTIASTDTGRVDFDELVWPREFSLAYVVTWVHSDVERAAELRLSSSDAIRAWCNDGLVLSEELIAGGDLDNLIAPVALHPGWNKILVKSANRRGAWWLRARLTDGDGQALPGLGYSAAAQAYTPSPGRGDTDTLAPPSAGGPENRRRFLESRRRARSGQDRATLAAMQPFLADAPHNLLAMYFGALTFWDNDELGRTIDLLNAGVAATDGAATAFLIKRSRYYNGKQLYEKALTDLRAAVARGSWTRAAQLELSSLYAQRGWHVDRCTTLDTVLAATPDLPWALYQRAACADALGFDQTAARYYDRVLAIHPGDRGALERKLDLAWRRLDWSAAARTLGTLRRLDPDVADHLLSDGDLARRLGDRARARRDYESAARMVPEWPRPWERLANLAYESGRRDEALADWKAQHDRDPNNTAAAQRIEFLQPTRLGAIDRFVPDEAAIERALAQKPKKAPGSQSALLFDHEVTEIHTDGSAQSVATTVQVAFTDQGRDALTHRRLPAGGTLKVLHAYSINDKGERQEASSIRGGEVRFRNLQVGSKVVLQYMSYQPPGHFLPNAYASQWFFQGVNEQHEESRWILLVPQGRPLHVQVIGAVAHDEAVKDGFTIHTFSSKNMAPLVQEQHMPPAWDLLASVSVSTVDGWDDYVRWERALLSDAFRSNDKLDALVDKLIADAKSPREKLDRLFHWATQEVRYQQDYETTIAGVRPHAASAVIERGYGDCKDKAVLLIEMARRAGVKLRFAILRTIGAGKMRRDVPDQQFNHAIVYVPQQTGIDAPLFLDPTSDGLDMGNLRGDDQGATALVMDPESGRWEFVEIPYQAAELQFDRHKIHIDVKSPTEALATDEVVLRGMVAMAVRHFLRNEGMAKKMYESLSSMLFPGTTLRNAKVAPKEDTWEPVTLALDIDVSSAMQPEDDAWRMRLPGTFELARVMDLKTRETPLQLGPLSSTRYDVEATLPEGYKIVHAPKDYSVEHACFALKRHAAAEARKLVVQIDYRRTCAEVSVRDYDEFRAAVQRGVQRFQDDLVFAKVEAPATRAGAANKPRGR
jgi:cellulose synthase operon protein C